VLQLLHETALLCGVTWWLFVHVTLTQHSIYVSPVCCSDHI